MLQILVAALLPTLLKNCSSSRTPRQAEPIKSEKRAKTEILRDACHMMREHSHLDKTKSTRQSEASPRSDGQTTLGQMQGLCFLILFFVM